MPLFGPPNISKLKEKGDIAGLIKALEHKDTSVQINAARALCTFLSDPRAFQALSNKLTAGGGLGQAIVQEFGESANPNVIEPLVTSLGLCWHPGEDAGDYEHCILQALGKIGDPVVIPLVKMLCDESVDRESGYYKDCVNIIPLIGTPAVTPLFKAHLELDDQYKPILNDMLRSIGDLAIPEIKEALIGKGRKASQVAAEILLMLDWKPSNDPVGNKFKMMQKERTQRSELDKYVEQILSGDLASRRRAANQLVMLYHSGKLDRTECKKILKHRATITRNHVDHRSHEDRDGHEDDANENPNWLYHECASDNHYDRAVHHDTKKHTDTGIGVDFPL